MECLFFIHITTNMNKLVIILIIIQIIVVSSDIRCSSKLKAKIFNSLVKYRYNNNTVILATAFPKVSNITGIPESIVRRCMGFTS